MKKFSLSLLAVVLLSFYMYAQTGAIKGTVFDETGQPLPYASAYIHNGGHLQGSTTDEKGNFVIKPLPPGSYNLKVTSLGYDTVVVHNIYVDSDEDKFINNIYMGQKDIMLGTATVTANKLIDVGDVNKMSIRSADLAVLPGNGDLTAVIGALIPGVKIDNGEMFVRGARSGSNIVLMDGVKVSSLSAGMPKSSYGSLMVYTGGIPAKYGDVSGGVIIVESKSFFDLYNQRKAEKEEKELKARIEKSKQGQ